MRGSWFWAQPARDDLFGMGAEAIGQTVRIDNLEFTVVGITKAKGGSGFNNPDNAAYIPLYHRPADDHRQSISERYIRRGRQLQ